LEKLKGELLMKNFCDSDPHPLKKEASSFDGSY